MRERREREERMREKEGEGRRGEREYRGLYPVESFNYHMYMATTKQMGMR